MAKTKKRKHQYLERDAVQWACVKRRYSADEMATAGELCGGDTDLLWNGHRVHGTIYMAGLTIECLLKSALVRKYGYRKDIEPLLYGHDLAKLLSALNDPRLLQGANLDLIREIRIRLNEWNIFIRYSDAKVPAYHAESFMRVANEVRKCLG